LGIEKVKNSKIYVADAVSIASIFSPDDVNSPRAAARSFAPPKQISLKFRNGIGCPPWSRETSLRARESFDGR
jgi:hypothetical protein